MSGSLNRTGRLLWGLSGVAIAALAFEALGRAGIIDRDFLPPTSDVVVRAVKLLGDAEFRHDAAATLTAWALGLVITIVVAVPLGLLLGSIPLIGTATRAVVEFLRPIPSVALIPLAGLILSSGTPMEVALIVYAASWPVLFNTIYGLQDVDPVAKETLRGFGFGPLRVLWRVSLPSAAPYIATGVRLAASVALIMAIATEILSSYGTGIGVFINNQAINVPVQSTGVLAATFWAGAFGMVVNAVLVRGERRVLHWHTALGRGGR